MEQVQKKKIHFRGARKTAVASCYISKKDTKAGIIINDKDYKDYLRVDKFIRNIDTLVLPHVLQKSLCIRVKSVGGGLNSQAQAVVTSILKCLFENFEDLASSLKPQKAYQEAIRHDPRNKWRNTIGSHGANRTKQSRKR